MRKYKKNGGDCMNKLKNSYIDKMVDQQLSSKEIDFILYIAKYQNESGIISSVYYKDVCSAINISIQKFYDIVNSLQEKDLISTEKISRADICVTLIGNSFYDKDFSVGYLNVASMDLQNQKFCNMKAGSKLLYLYMQRFIQGKHMLVQNFYEGFCKLFQRSKKSIQVYLHELKANYYLFISKKRNRAYNYEMTIKNSTVLNKSKLDVPYEKDGFIDNIKELIKRNFGQALPEQNQDKVLNDIAGLAVTKKAECYQNIAILIVDAVKASLLQQKKEKKQRPVLNAALINMHLSKAMK